MSNRIHRRAFGQPHQWKIHKQTAQTFSTHFPRIRKPTFEIRTTSFPPEKKTKFMAGGGRACKTSVHLKVKTMFCIMFKLCSKRCWLLTHLFSKKYKNLFLISVLIYVQFIYNIGILITVMVIVIV